MNAGEEVVVPAAVLGGSPARRKARSLLNALSPMEERAMQRECLWHAGEPTHRIILDDVPIVGPDGKLGHLADLDIEDMVATLVEHSTFARFRRRREAEAFAALAEREAEALPQCFKEQVP
jgi:hypothetical protein